MKSHKRIRLYVPTHFDERKEDLADTLHTIADYYHRRLISCRLLPNSHRLGVVVDDLRQFIEVERSPTIQAHMSSGFGSVPSSHPLHIKGCTHTIILCAGVLSELPEDDHVPIAQRMVFNAMVPLLLRRMDRVYDFARMDEKARIALLQEEMAPWACQEAHQ